MTQIDPNTDDYAQFVGRMAQEMREALAPHFAVESLLDKLSTKWSKHGRLSVDVAESISFAWGARSSHAKLLAPPHELLPAMRVEPLGGGARMTQAEADDFVGLLRTFRGLRPRFVHCMGCLLPVTPSRSRFTFSSAPLTEAQVQLACETAALTQRTLAHMGKAAPLALMRDGVTPANVSEATT